MSEAMARDAAGRDGGARLYQLTLLFSDLSGYTALMESADPEDVDVFRRQLAEAAKRSVEKHGGTVNQLHGDGVLAVFGLPVPHEEDARRAVQAALELHDDVRNLSIEGRFPAAFQPRMHTAIETGLVLARQGSQLTGQYELTGDAVNTAARLCSAAQSDELLVSQPVHGFVPTWLAAAIAQRAGDRSAVRQRPAAGELPRSDLDRGRDGRRRQPQTAASLGLRPGVRVAPLLPSDRRSAANPDVDGRHPASPRQRPAAPRAADAVVSVDPDAGSGRRRAGKPGVLGQ